MSDRQEPWAGAPPARFLAYALFLATALLATPAAAMEDDRAEHRTENWRADGTYVLKTDDLRSIQAYYRDVGMGPLYLAKDGGSADMRETCLLLGEHWRPLGHVPVPRNGGEETWKFELCYYAAGNPEHVARAKCANLGMALQENRPRQREVVCARREPAPTAKGPA